MVTLNQARHLAYGIVALGCVVAFVAAVVPFYTAGYRLDGLVLSSILIPFAVYGMLSTRLEPPWLLAAGGVILAATLFVVVEARFLHYDGYRDGLIYWVPLLASAVPPIAWVFGRRPRDAD